MLRYTPIPAHGLVWAGPVGCTLRITGQEALIDQSLLEYSEEL